MKPNQHVIIFRGLTMGVIILLVIAFVQHRRNKQLTESNNQLLLQNDSVLSVNLQLQRDINFLKHDLDSLANSDAEKQLTSR
ncbi:hypothetical protein FAM09_19565 [Niastella caeni]|uniref:Uncharacterized protein n=1 Tax=Niastella caeni TaxID=2569763 RepID=A0A4S8HP30_9BACT|nr:hypothetical protein [Niastella caeni]THU37150.1 hypothetical protein FAM09_19565 [Niastella caeni]